MSQFGVLVIGPAGAGKSSFCAALVQQLQHSRRSSFYVNLDPAAQAFAHAPDLDIRDLITLEDAMEELALGPNGALLYCFEFLLDNVDFLVRALEPVPEDCLVILDMPGQIELYTHVPLLPLLVKELTQRSLHISLCAAYLLEASFVASMPKFFAGVLSAMSTMLMLEMPHLNILSKVDLVQDVLGGGGRAGGAAARRQLKRFLDPNAGQMLADSLAAGAAGTAPPSDGTVVLPPAAPAAPGARDFGALNQAVARLIDDFGLVSFLRLDSQDEDSVGAVLSHIDNVIQYHEAQEPREPREVEE